MPSAARKWSTMKRNVLIAVVVALVIVLVLEIAFLFQKKEVAVQQDPSGTTENTHQTTAQTDAPEVAEPTDTEGAQNTEDNEEELPVVTIPVETQPSGNGGNQSGQTAKPTESTKPTETSKPTESTEPAETSKPTESTEPAETSKPAESTEPTETTKPEETEPEETDDDGLGENELPPMPI